MQTRRIVPLSLLLLIAVSESSRSQAQRLQVAATASIDGTLFRLGTNEPISGADIELTRVEGTAAEPLARGAAEALAGLQNFPFSVDAAPPPALAPEVQFTKSEENGRFRFTSLKPGGYRLVA